MYHTYIDKFFGINLWIWGTTLDKNTRLTSEKFELDVRPKWRNRFRRNVESVNYDGKMYRFAA